MDLENIFSSSIKTFLLFVDDSSNCGFSSKIEIATLICTLD